MSKPDIRYRPKIKNSLNKQVYKDFIKENPELKSLSYNEFKLIVRTFNRNLVGETITNRDGIKLPKNLGYVLITKYRSENSPMNVIASRDLKKRVNHLNWDTDNYIAKICYTNNAINRRFANKEIWSFKGARNFTRLVSHTFKDNYLNYIDTTDGILPSNYFKNL